MELDKTHRLILDKLKHNARASVTEIASELRLSRLTVQSRINAMKDAAVIRRFTIELADAQDEDVIRAVSLIELKGTKSDAVKRALQRMTEVTSLHTTNGKWGLVANTETRNLATFDRLLNRIGKIDGVTNVETCLLLSRIV